MYLTVFRRLTRMIKSYKISTERQSDLSGTVLQGEKLSCDPNIRPQDCGPAAKTCPFHREGAHRAPSAFQETGHDQDDHQSHCWCQAVRSVRVAHRAWL